MNAELAYLLADHQPLHSAHQMDYFITQRNGLTPYGCLKQCLRELNARYKALRDLYISAVELGVDVDIQKDKLKTKLSAKHLIKERAKLLRAEAAVQDNADCIKATEKEFLHFLGQARALKKIVGELTPEARDKKEAEYWNAYVNLMQALDRTSVREQVSRETLEIGFAMGIKYPGLNIAPDETMKKIAAAREPVTFPFEAERAELQLLLCG